jgi:hypothetical protein
LGTGGTDFVSSLCGANVKYFYYKPQLKNIDENLLLNLYDDAYIDILLIEQFYNML